MEQLIMLPRSIAKFIGARKKIKRMEREEEGKATEEKGERREKRQR